MLPCAINGVHIQVNFLIMSVASIIACHTSHAGLPEVAAHPVASILTQQLFKFPIDMPTKALRTTFPWSNPIRSTSFTAC
jgi:hypothetical protein